MRELRLVFERKDDLSQAISILSEREAVYRKKLVSYQQRIDFHKENECYELFRSRYYRRLGDEPQQINNQVTKEQVVSYWNTMWTKPNKEEEKDYTDYLLDYIPPGDEETVFPLFQEFQDILKWLPAWRAAGCDGVYNFFIKRCTSIHKHLYEQVKRTCLGNEKAEEWFYRGITYLLPKGIPKVGSDHRPITCMSNLYKLTTKCVTRGPNTRF